MSAEYNLTEHDYELLSAYIDGALSDSEQAEVERRLTTEEQLRQELEALQQTVALIHQLPTLKAPRSYTLDQAAAARAREAQRGKIAEGLQRRYPPSKGRADAPPSKVIEFPARRIPFSLISAAAAVFVLVIAAAVLLSNSGQPPATSMSSDAEVAAAPTRPPSPTVIAPRSDEPATGGGAANDDGLPAPPVAQMSADDATGAEEAADGIGFAAEAETDGAMAEEGAAAPAAGYANGQQALGDAQQPGGAVGGEAPAQPLPTVTTVVAAPGVFAQTLPSETNQAVLSNTTAPEDTAALDGQDARDETAELAITTGTTTDTDIARAASPQQVERVSTADLRLILLTLIIFVVQLLWGGV